MTHSDSAPTYTPVSARVDLPALEHEVLGQWERDRTFERSLQASRGKPSWVFYEGPPTANGTPGTHHVEARAFKDIFPRYRTMKGYDVQRRAGWDCHGLPVELAVEKELGISGKPDIERYSVAQFNARCRESVLRHVDEFSVMTRRMGYWVDLDRAYWTMDTSYIESVWWSLAQIAAKGLLVEDYRVSPYCPRCGTTLSDHELGLGGYEEVTDPSVYVRFPVADPAALGLAEDGRSVSFLVWTTTPWTLVSNTAIAVHPQESYVAVAWGEEVLILCEPLLSAALGQAGESDSEPVVLARWTGQQLEGLAYRRPLDLLDAQAFTDASAPSATGHHQPPWTVLLAEYVTTEDGTGIVHQAPAFGAEDRDTCRKYGLPVVNPIQPDGHFSPEVQIVGGQYFKQADLPLVELLRQRGLLFAHLPYQHPYPHCWRCHQGLLYYATPAWYIRTTAIRDALLRENENTTWHPETIKHGRYGDWLRNNVDWALSRERYWGTPLPVWRCADKHMTVVQSLAHLSELTGSDCSQLDPHRPFIDEVHFPCPQCGAQTTREKAVIDCWYDSGSMPFAQLGFPHLPDSDAQFKASYPAQYICEAIDQTRGWFYTLMAVGTLTFDQSSYETVLCLGHLLAEDGRKMSKHLGNIILPVPLMDTHGADAVRWFMLCGGSPWQARRVGDHVLQEIVRKVLLTYWNTVSFQTLYGSLAGFSPLHTPAPPPADRPLLDRWALSRAHTLVRDVDAALEGFDTQRAGTLLADYIDELSNWYVRRSRRRFWSGDAAALATLHECLRLLTLMLAPFVPFITERVWQEVVVATDANAPDSVHLASWPECDLTCIDPQLEADVACVRRLVELGRSARAQSGVRTRQPLGRALVAAPGWAGLPQQLRDEIAEELNVESVQALDASVGELVDHSVKANFRALGQRFGKGTQPVAAALAAADPSSVEAALREQGSVLVQVNGEPITVTADEVILTSTPRQGWAVEASGGETVALDLHITPELLRSGYARETVRLIQEARKAAGLEVSDRIHLWWQAEVPDLAQALTEHSATITEEVLARSFTSTAEQPAPADAHPGQDPDLGLTFWLAKA